MLIQMLRERSSTYFLREMCVILSLGATLHFIAVTHLYLTSGFPDSTRVAYIYLIGFLQIAVGLLDLLAYRTLGNERKLTMLASFLAASLVTGYVLVIAPFYLNFSFAFKLAPPAYLLYHWWVVLKLKAVSTS